MLHTSLQLREVFHLEFLRRLARAIKSDSYALKGGVNLRFFFGSFRYSEDMDFDVKGIEVIFLSDAVMKILSASSFRETLKPFGIESVIPPDISISKQTQTTQRFKIHLISEAGEDLFTKLEFSRRGFSGNAVVQPVSSAVLRAYRIAPVLASHYEVNSAITQKLKALAGRSVIQARDIFDIYVLSSQTEKAAFEPAMIKMEHLEKAYENIFSVNYEQFRDTVVSYLSPEDQDACKSEEMFSVIQLKTAEFIQELGNSFE